MANHIQIGAIAPRIQYTGDGVQTVFTYPFAIFEIADMDVYVDGVKQTAGFVVSGAGNSAGGAVTFTTAPAGGTVVTLTRNLAIARTSDFQDAGEFRAKVINDELDYMTAALQQVADSQSRSLQLPLTQVGVIGTEVPSPVANTTLMWNATADGLTNGPSADAIVAVQANALQSAADRVQTGLDASASAASAVSAASSASAASTTINGLAVPGASGNVLTSDGTNWTSAAAVSAGLNYFQVRPSLDQSIPVATRTTVVLDTVDYDTGANFDVTTYQFTPPNGEVWLLFARHAILMDEDGKQIYIEFGINGGVMLNTAGKAIASNPIAVIDATSVFTQYIVTGDGVTPYGVLASHYNTSAAKTLAADNTMFIGIQLA